MPSLLTSILMNNNVFIIYGPTAVGKTDLVLSLANHIPCEVINMDSAQFYEPLSIGTAKPDLSAISVPHHLFDYIKTPENFTVVAYREKALQLINDIQKRGKTPILVGGSGFYLKSLFFTPHELARVEAPENKKDYSWEMLHAIDPVRAQDIEPSDTYRIARALDIWYTTGQKPSTCVPSFAIPFSFHLIYVARDRDALYQRINQRVDSMLEQGFLQEVRGLLDTPWEAFLQQKKFIGYNELIDYLRGTISYKNAVETIKKRSRNYAKRQETFWRMLKRELSEKLAQTDKKAGTIEELNLTISDAHLYIKELLHNYTRHEASSLRIKLRRTGRN